MRPNLTIVLTSLLAIQIVNPLFSAPVTFATRQALDLDSPVLTLADINKDGKTDIVAAVVNPVSNEYEVSIQLGSGNGTFTQGPAVNLGPGVTPTAIATGDFNGDGLLDIAVLSSNSTAVYILTQGFTGFTTTPIQIPENTSATLNIGVADLNGDHLPDLIIPSAEGAVLLLSSGGGNFHTPILANSTASLFVVAADVNGDKNQDLVLSAGGYCCSSAITILLGDGHGGFDAPLSQPALFNISARIAVADFNRDGKVDIASLSLFNPGSVMISLGNGDGTFASPNSFSLPSQVSYGLSVVAGDLNGDGAVDLAVLATSSSSSTAVIGFLNEGKGTFGPANLYPVQYTANVVLLGNLNADTYLDAAVYTNDGGSAVSLLFNTEHGAFSDGEVIATTNPPQYLVSGDFNGDGSLDLASVSLSSGLSVLLNTGNNRSLFNPLTSLPFFTGPLVAGDFNNDGKDDLVVLNNGSGETLLGNGNGTFHEVSSSFSTGVSANSAIAADMNGDGKLDLVTNSPSINLGNGDGTFQPPYIANYNYCYTGGAVAVADFNKDGKPDIMTSCEGSLSLYPGNGDGTVGFPVFNDYVSGLQSFAVGDFNRDGIPDVAFTSSPNFYLPSSTSVTILIGQGNGTFATGITIPLLTGATGLIVAGEFDGNGVIDLAVLDNNDSVFTILRGNGDGTFQLPELFGTATSPTCILNGRFRAGSVPGEQDLVFCAGQGIAVDLNTTK